MREAGQLISHMQDMERETRTHGSSEQAGQFEGSPLQTGLEIVMVRPVECGCSMAQTVGALVTDLRRRSGTAGS